MTEQNFKPGDRVEVTLVTEVICVRPNGQVLLRNIGMPIPAENVRKVEKADVAEEHATPDS